MNSELRLPVKLLYWLIGLSAIGIALFYLIAYSGKYIPPPANMPNGVFGNFNTLIEIPIPFTSYLLPIYPYSAIMLGVFLIALEHKFGWRALPLLLMAAGAFDVIEKQAIAVRIYKDPFWLTFQLILMVGGWVLSGRPTFKTKDWSLPLVIVSLLVCAQTQFYDFFELSLYIFVYRCTQLGAKLT